MALPPPYLFSAAYLWIRDSICDSCLWDTAWCVGGAKAQTLKRFVPSGPLTWEPTNALEFRASWTKPSTLRLRLLYGDGCSSVVATRPRAAEAQCSSRHDSQQIPHFAQESSTETMMDTPQEPKDVSHCLTSFFAESSLSDSASLIVSLGRVPRRRRARWKVHFRTLYPPPVVHSRAVPPLTEKRDEWLCYM
jgi:hypothetical protein